LVGALEDDAERTTRAVDLGLVVPWLRLGVPAGVLAIVVLMGLAALVEKPEFRLALRRALLLPGAYTTLDVTPGDQTLKAGSEFTLDATVTGRPVSRVVWSRRPVASQDPWVDEPIGSTEPGVKLAGTLSARLKDCQADFEYRVTAGAVASPTYRVKVIHPLVVRSLAATTTPPAYTRQPPATQADGNLKVIEGSNVAFRITLDRAPAAASLVVRPADPKQEGEATVPLRVEGSTLTGELTALNSPVDYEIQARADDGMVLDPKRYTIRVRPDEKPTVRFARPVEELAVIPTAEVAMKVEAGDDFGVARVGLVYQIDNGPKETLALDELKGQSVTAALLATLYLEKHPLDFTHSLTYYAYAEDNRPGRPNRTTTDLRYIDILPFQQAFQKVEGGNCTGQSLTLGELIARQRSNLARTFAHADDGSLEPETARRLTETQTAIMELTAEFTQGMEERVGPVPALNEAFIAMTSARDALERRDPAAAIPAEETALAALIKAKQNLRKALSESQSASQCRNFDRQMQQKIRRDRKKKDEPPRQLAQSLRSLAQEQRKISDDLKTASSGSSPSSKPESSKSSNPGGSASARQDAALKKAEDVARQMKNDSSLSDLARDRMAEAKGQMERASDDLRTGQDAKAPADARDAAERLERLAEQVEGLKAADLAAKLAAAKALAQGLARQEADLAQRIGREEADAPTQAAEQRGLAEGAKTLDDWLRRFRTDAADESRPLSESLRRAAAANPPSESAEAMTEAAAMLAAGKPGADGPAARAAGQLDALARDLDAARRAFVQPKLDQLLAAERQAAQTQEALRSARDEADMAKAEQAVADLLKTVDSLKPGSTGNRPLASATDTLAQSVQHHGGWSRPSGGDFRPDGKPTWVPPRAYTNGVQDVIVALQSTIQEMILKDALQARDEPVPPRYKTMVEDYYRVLSEDLR
jgi:hypothetical protein